MSIEELEAKLEVALRRSENLLHDVEELRSDNEAARDERSTVLAENRRLFGVLEAVTRERDEAERERDAQQRRAFELYGSALALQIKAKLAEEERDEARTCAEERNDEISRLQRCLNMAATERDEARAEAKRADVAAAAEHANYRATYDDLRRVAAEGRLELETATRLRRERDAARAEVERLTKERDEARAEVERLMHQLADATNESTHFQVMCKRETEEVERLARQVELLTDERDELLVRVANQDAELRATREAYRDAYRRGAEAMREKAAAAIVCPAESCPCKGASHARTIRALPIPEEP